MNLDNLINIIYDNQYKNKSSNQPLADEIKLAALHTLQECYSLDRTLEIYYNCLIGNNQIIKKRILFILKQLLKPVRKIELPKTCSQWFQIYNYFCEKNNLTKYELELICVLSELDDYLILNQKKIQSEQTIFIQFKNKRFFQ